jgi:hypothetical protein
VNARAVVQGFVVGAGLSGCATSLLSFFSQLEAAGGGGQRTPADVAPAAFVYFGAAAAISGLCILCFSLLTRLKYSRTKLGPYLASRYQHPDISVASTAHQRLGLPVETLFGAL